MNEHLSTISEARLQSNCVRWLWNTHPKTRGLFFSVTNNSEHIGRGVSRKALGLVPGVADCIFLWKGFAHFIEFKKQFGKQSLEQKSWQAKVEEHEFDYYIVRTESDFKEIINSILGEN